MCVELTVRHLPGGSAAIHVICSGPSASLRVSGHLNTIPSPLSTTTTSATSKAGLTLAYVSGRRHARLPQSWSLRGTQRWTERYWTADRTAVADGAKRQVRTADNATRKRTGRVASLDAVVVNGVRYWLL